jgi:hypothetical protein
VLLAPELADRQAGTRMAWLPGSRRKQLPPPLFRRALSATAWNWTSATSSPTMAASTICTFENGV